MATLNIARQQARKQGINITDKKEISGYRVSDDVMTDSVLTEQHVFFHQHISIGRGFFIPLHT